MRVFIAIAVPSALARALENGCRVCNPVIHLAVLMSSLSKSRRLIASALLALWPSALLHCDLEAAHLEWPLLVHHDHDDAGGHEDQSLPAADHSTEDPGIQASGLVVKVRAPGAWMSEGTVACIPKPLAKCLATPPPKRAAPVWLHKSWHFNRRAAMPARAPDFTA